MSEQSFLNPRFLQYFIAVADTDSILSASVSLNVSQPSITRAIQIIEKNLNKKLFIRTKKGMQLTTEGELFYFNVKNILAYNEKVIENIRSNNIEIKETKSEIIRFGLPNTLTFTHKQNILWLIKKNNQTKKIIIIEDDNYKLIDLISKNQIDFAICCLQTFDNNIVTTNLYNDPFCITFYKGHKFQNLKNVDIEMVREEPNYVYRNTCEFFFYSEYKKNGKFPDRDEVKKTIKKRKEKNSDNRDMIYTDSDTTAASCVKSGLGVAVMPESVAIDHKLLFKHLTKPNLTRNISLIQNKKNKNKLEVTEQALKNAIWL